MVRKEIDSLPSSTPNRVRGKSATSSKNATSVVGNEQSQEAASAPPVKRTAGKMATKTTSSGTTPATEMSSSMPTKSTTTTPKAAATTKKAAATTKKAAATTKKPAATTKKAAATTKKAAATTKKAAATTKKAAATTKKAAATTKKAAATTKKAAVEEIAVPTPVAAQESEQKHAVEQAPEVPAHVNRYRIEMGGGYKTLTIEVEGTFYRGAQGHAGLAESGKPFEVSYLRNAADLHQAGEIDRVEMYYRINGGEVLALLLADGQRDSNTQTLVREIGRIDIPADSRGELEYWFRLITTDGRVLWDSDFGRNHRAEILDSSELFVSFDGERADAAPAH